MGCSLHPQDGHQAVKRPKYPLPWAYGVAKQLQRNYPRATETVLYWLDITDKQWANFLAYNDPVWVQLRNFIKEVDYLVETRGFGIGPHLRNYCAKWLQGKGYERIRVRLDKHPHSYTELKSREQAEAGVSAASSAEAPADVISGGGSSGDVHG